MNRANYAEAAELVASGYWVVDPEAGVVTNAAGRVLGTTAKGYVALSMGGGPSGVRRIRAHRVIWESVHGPIPDGLEINHMNSVRNDNRICNLEMVTHSANLAHGFRQGNIHPPRTRPKLTAAQVEAVMALRGLGWTQERVAAVFGVTTRTLRKVERPGYVPDERAA